MKRVTKRVAKVVGRGPLQTEKMLPAGLRVKQVPLRRGEYWLEEFPPEYFSALERHDAEHYGIVYLERETEVTP